MCIAKRGCAVLGKEVESDGLSSYWTNFIHADYSSLDFNWFFIDMT